MTEPEAWRADAACTTKDPELFFPTANTAAATVPRAKAVCATCPAHVVTECARQALELRSAYGVWAGIYLGETAKTRHTARGRLKVIAGVDTRVPA